MFIVCFQFLYAVRIIIVDPFFLDSPIKRNLAEKGQEILGAIAPVISTII
jgi:hypothetical protein